MMRPWAQLQIGAPAFPQKVCELMKMGASDRLKQDKHSTGSSCEEDSYKEYKSGRPSFSPCSTCGRKFTERALEIHKRSCTEKSDCACRVCKLDLPDTQKCGNSNKNKDIITGFEKLSVESTTGAVPKRRTSKKSLNNIGNGKSNVTKIINKNRLTDENCFNNLLNGTSILKVEENSPQNIVVFVSPDNSTAEHGIFQSQKEIPENNLGPQLVIKKAKPKHRARTSASHFLLCTVCNDSIYWEVFGDHILDHCRSEERFQCPKCENGFTKPGKMLIHFSKHMPKCNFFCPKCDRTFQVFLDMARHVRADHGDKEFNQHHCYICLGSFSHSQTITNHMRLHSKENPYICNVCHKKFNQVGNLNRHLSVHRGDRPHACFICSRAFADPATLRNHLRTHTKEAPYKCFKCGRRFTQVGNLKRHMSSHLRRIKNGKSFRATRSERNRVTTNSEVQFSIDEDGVENSMDMGNYDGEPDVMKVIKKEIESDCNTKENDNKKLFPSMPDSKSMLICKEKNWEGFVCPECGKVCTWQHDLRIHYRIHTGEKPYGCNICGQRFAQGGAVRTHKRRHHSDHPDVAKS